MIFRDFLHNRGLHSWKCEGTSQETKPYPSLVKTDLYGEATDEPAASVVVIGYLSDHDWQKVQARLRIALAVT